MIIYVGHPSSINYREDLYKPLKNSDLDEEHTVILPHEESKKQFDSKPFLENQCDLFIAEVSKPSIGLGIELGWADMYDVPIVCVHREGSEPSGSLQEVADNIKPYRNVDKLIRLIENVIKEDKN